MELQHGDRFGRLTVIRKDGAHRKPCGTTQSKYLCQCDCGNQIIIFGQNLRTGNTKSCGCLSKEIKAARRLPESKGVINQIILQYKRHARDRGLSWELNYDQVKELINAPCYKDFATVVFARNRNEARSLAMRTDACEDLSYLEIEAKRSPALDNSYRGRWEMDWYDPQDRIDLVRFGGFSCSDEMDDRFLDCVNCPANEWCDKYQDRRDDNGA